MYERILAEITKMKFRYNPSSEGRDVPRRWTDGRTDGHGEARYRYRFASVLKEGLFQLCIVARTRPSAKKQSNTVLYFKEQLRYAKYQQTRHLSEPSLCIIKYKL